MATTLLQQTPHHFSQIPSHYSSAIYGQYTDQHNTEVAQISGIPVSATDQQLPYTSPPRWSAQQAYPRRASKSPNISDRTPIRHNRPEMSRHCSNTRPQALLAYAEQQVAQAPADAPSTLYATSLEPVPQTYQGQPFAFPPVTSPYVHQQQYYDTSNSNFMQLPGQQDALNVVNMYTSGRHNLPLRHNSQGSLNPNETMYSQPRAAQLPSMSPIPLKFPPIPQPLESTPNEVDVVNSRQKPQCWEHGCNGRQFSTFSNLLRHQREKSGTATKARCPHCGTEFTRTTARNGHLYGGKCKGLSDQSRDEESQAAEDKDLKS